jgi:myo-inositol-1(or 4)-monophosphatase
MLDQHLQPCAGIVYAPCLQMLFFADLGKRATCNGREIKPLADETPITRASNLMVTSRLHHELDLSAFPGKIRSLGSGALHMCLPLVSPPLTGALGQRGAYIWDIAAAHAICRSVGYDVELWSGQPVDYAQMIHGSPATEIIISGAPDRRRELRHAFVQ